MIVTMRKLISDLNAKKEVILKFIPLNCYKFALQLIFTQSSSLSLSLSHLTMKFFHYNSGRCYTTTASDHYHPSL